MEMEFMAEFTEGISRDRARQIIKGKRTKRHRPSSPFGMYTNSLNNSNNSSNGDCLIENFTPDQSPTMSSEASTKEDEDMANCLILLAQSVSPVKEEDDTYHKSDLIRHKTERLNARRFATVGERSGFYVYECKTCNRTFPSFQALGGHRASHKKPKVNVEEKKSGSVDVQPPLIEYVEAEEDHDQYNYKPVEEEDEDNKASVIIVNTNNVQKSPASQSSSFVQTGTATIMNHNTKSKVHECSICGSEFLSGQALGGHMRKHRPIPVTSNRTVISTNTDDIITDHEKSPSMLSLDLNFPPPEESKFQFTAGGSSQQHLVFSTPAFVDCHY
ncbi:hypothetical protein QVD17_00877 [Tagetes erecta]|uniref:C2H2-type domain-containing protein n=1 Tax=Tagetes erecta TaxID=13708 RepID=A0AAD8LB21_TARER|nr:hypothetical protein QVD17_00877 [Tagetes erecta]